MNTSILILVLVVIMTVTLGSQYTESFATSPGTLLQLKAKGLQDSYLTGLPRYPFDYLPYYWGMNWTRSVPYYYYSRTPPTYLSSLDGGRPIYGRPFYADRPIYYTPLRKRWSN